MEKPQRGKSVIGQTKPWHLNTTTPPAWLACDLDATILGASLWWSAALGQEGAVLLSLQQDGLSRFLVMASILPFPM